MSQDARVTPLRDGVAAAHLERKVEAERFVKGQSHRVTAARTRLWRRPGEGMDTELLHGEDFTVYGLADGWAWGQSELDGYVGYVRSEDVVQPGPAPTHRVCTLGAHFYRAPELKIPPAGRFPFGARLYVAQTTETHAQIGPESWMPLPQLAPVDTHSPDFVAVAEMFEGTPYVWGGRSSAGIDCSGLVQLSLQAAGVDCPRDSDMQHDALGRTLEPAEPLQRGDLVFWKGHVGIMRTKTLLLHANAHHMAVAVEPLAKAIKRISAHEFGEIIRRARLDADASAT